MQSTSKEVLPGINAEGALAILRRHRAGQRNQIASHPKRAEEIRQRYVKAHEGVVRRYNQCWAEEIVSAARQAQITTLKLPRMPDDLFGFQWDFADLVARIKTKAANFGITVIVSGE